MSDTESSTITQTTPLIVYGTPTCPMLPPVMGLLKTSKVPHTYINIWQDDDARQRVRDINNGNESVPTLVFPDGSTLTEPATAELSARLREEGYHVPLLSRLIGNAFPIMMFLIIAFAVLRFFEVI